MNQQGDGELLQVHEVLFLDFLGFADAVAHWSDKRMGRLIEVLATIANTQSAHDIKGEAQPDGSYKITGRAEITTFSDHIVMSYPSLVKSTEINNEMWEIISNGWAGMVREQMQSITAQVAIAGLEVGLLVRGGLSRGKLYHQGHVVVGEAMIDAYHLESRIAKNARVVVSPRVSGYDRLYKDEDGQRCLDYVGKMMMLLTERHGTTRDWMQAKLAAINATISNLTENGKSNEAAKWLYFRDKLHFTAQTWN